MRYVIINVTTLEGTGVLAVGSLKQIQFMGRLAKADGYTVMAPPLEGRGLSRLSEDQAKWLYWNMFQQAPGDYQDCIIAIKAKLDEWPDAPVSVEQLEQMCIARGLDGTLSTPADTPSDNTQEGGKPEKIKRAPRVPRAQGDDPARPAPGSTTGKVWTICDELSANRTKDVSRAEIMAACTAAGINPATAGTQYAKWKKASQPAS